MSEVLKDICKIAEKLNNITVPDCNGRKKITESLDEIIDSLDGVISYLEAN